jgi:hypothetical protein
MPDISPPVNPFEPSGLQGITLPLGELMWTIEQFFVQEEIDFFHPSDVEFIARQSSPDRDSPFVVIIRAEFVISPRGDVEINLYIQGVTGTATEFDSFIDRLHERINEVSTMSLMNAEQQGQ